MNFFTYTERQLANHVLKEIEEKEGKISFPIDPFKLLKDSGVLISFSDFEKLEGIILNDEDNVTIVSINRQRPWTRQRFSAAHEYCHFIKDLKRTTDELSQIECWTKTNEPIEKYADNFASELLMPIKYLKEKCDEYKDEKGFISFESIIYISEYFGVSFESCLFRIAYKLRMIEGDVEPSNLKKKIRKFKPDVKRKELIATNNDFLLIGNAIDSFTYCMVDLSNNIGAKFLNKYIYYDNKLENVEQENVPYILADLQYNRENSEFFKSDDDRIFMTLGNYAMQEYVLTTDNLPKISDCCNLHKILCSYAPFPEYSGFYRTEDAVLYRGTTQPVSWREIPNELEKLNAEFEYFKENNDELKISEYIERIVYFIYRFIKIHPFSDGNGRVSRALLNWMLKQKNIPPIYIDDSCRDEYYEALSSIDVSGDYVPLILLIEKRVINTLIELHDYLYIDETEVE